MLTEVIIETSNPTSLKIDEQVDEILVLKSISGLTSTKVNQYIGEFAKEGSYYQGRRAVQRNPVLNFKLQPNYMENITANKIREMLYRMFMEPQRDSDSVQVRLIDDELPDRYFIGYTEGIEADAWIKDLTAQVSLTTTDAYLRSAELSSAANPLGWFTLPLVYEGSADTGIQTNLKVLQDTDHITLANGPDLMKFEGTFHENEFLTVSTVQGQRTILLNGEDAMDAMTADSEWIQLKEQGNVLKMYGETLGDGKVALTSYSYRAAWWGI